MIKHQRSEILFKDSVDLNDYIRRETHKQWKQILVTNNIQTIISAKLRKYQLLLVSEIADKLFFSMLNVISTLIKFLMCKNIQLHSSLR